MEGKTQLPSLLSTMPGPGLAHGTGGHILDAAELTRPQ